MWSANYTEIQGGLMCHSILVTYIVYHTRNEVVSIMIVCMKGQKSDFMSNSSGTCDRIPFIYKVIRKLMIIRFIPSHYQLLSVIFGQDLKKQRLQSDIRPDQDQPRKEIKKLLNS